jgi:hypothetical protein
MHAALRRTILSKAASGSSGSVNGLASGMVGLLDIVAVVFVLALQSLVRCHDPRPRRNADERDKCCPPVRRPLR